MPDSWTFTIEDSDGDGICCTKGDGYYHMKVNGEIVASGGQFGDSDSYYYYPDGICSCTEGDGSYNIKVNGEIVASGGHFPNSDSYYNFVGCELVS